MMVQFAPDSKRIVSASGSELFFWSGDNRERTFSLAGPAAVSIDGEQIATADIDALTLISGKTIGRVIKDISYFGLPEGDILCHMSFSQDGKRLAVAGFQMRACVVTIATDNKTSIELNGGPAECIGISPSGSLLAVGNEKGIVEIYNSETGAHQKALKGSIRTISCIAFSRDGKLLAAGAEDGSIKVWNTADWTETRSWAAKGLVFGIAFSPDASALAYTYNVAEQQSAIEISSIAGGKPISRAEKLNYWVFALAFSPDGKKLAAGCEDSSVRIWTAK
jgi:WD40 repeat protein